MGISFLYNFDLGNRNILNPGSNILSVTSTAAGDFDKANLTTDSTRQKWRSADIASWQEIVIQAELSTNIDTFAIINHNLSPDAVIVLQANTSNSFLVPPVNITIPWSKANTIWCTALGGSYSYYKLRILDPTNPCGYIEIGRIVGGRALTMINNEDMSDPFSIDYNDKSKKMNAEGFFRVSTEIVVSRSLKYQFDRLNTASGTLNANFVGLQDLYATVLTTKPFVSILDRNNPSFVNMWGQLRQMPSEAYDINQFMSQQVQIDEIF